MSTDELVLEIRRLELLVGPEGAPRLEQGLDVFDVYYREHDRLAVELNAARLELVNRALFGDELRAV